MLYDFSWQGINSDFYGLMIGYLDSAPEDERVLYTYSNTFTRNKDNNGFYMTSSYIEEPIRLNNGELSIVKYDCLTGDYTMTVDELEEIVLWLTSTKNGKLVIKPFYADNVYLMGMFDEITELKAMGKTVGLSLSFVSTSAHFMKEDETFSGEGVTSLEARIYAKNFGHMKYLYPVYTITPKSSGDLTVTNSMWERSMVINNCTAGEVITIDALNKLFSSSLMTHELYNDFNYEFVPLVREGSTIAINNFTLSLECDISITYTPLLIGSGIFG